MPTILIVDDEPVQLRLLRASVERLGHNVIEATDGSKALEIILAKNQSVDAVILDLVMPETDGMAVLERLRRENNPVPVIVQTAKGGIETVVAAMREGAFDFLVKPASPQKLQAALGAVIKVSAATGNASPSDFGREAGFGFDDIITKSTTMAPVLKMAQKAAGSTIPVLVEGESGVGKEMIAKAIHGSSDRSRKPFITVNCGALPENLVESILFGHEKGAFTGAVEKRPGKFQEADGGTLFLDEVGELPLDLQVKLLRAIQENEIDPVGARRPVKVDIRIVSATNRNLEEDVKNGIFREDLYYRLNVLPLRVPPLRERREDIIPLAFHFAKKVARRERNLSISAFDPAVMTLLQEYDWPGNVRELENAIFRAVVLCEGDVLRVSEFPQITAQNTEFSSTSVVLEDGEHSDEASLLSIDGEVSMQTPVSDQEFTVNELGDRSPRADHEWASASQLPPTSGYGMVSLISTKGDVKPLAELEEEAIRFALEAYNNRMSEIARRLGIGRSTLYRKLKEFGIGEPVSED